MGTNMKKIILSLCTLALILSCATVESKKIERYIKKYPGGKPNPRCRFEEGACGCDYEKAKKIRPNRRPA